MRGGRDFRLRQKRRKSEGKGGRAGWRGKRRREREERGNTLKEKKTHGKRNKWKRGQMEGNNEQTKGSNR